MNPEVAPGPRTMQRAAGPAQTSLPALASLIFGVLGYTALPVLGALIAVVVGHHARKEIRLAGRSMDGATLANVGLLLGYSQLLMLVAAAGVVVLLVLIAAVTH